MEKFKKFKFFQLIAAENNENDGNKVEMDKSAENH